MIAYVKQRRNAFLWCLVYFIFVWMAYHISMVQQGLNFHEFLYGNLFNIQKYSFDVSIFFYSFLYIMKKPFVSTMFVSRCRESYFVHILIYGLKICLLYVGLTIVFFIGIPTMANVEDLVAGGIYLNARILFNFFNLFAFLFTIYQFYILALLISGKQVLSVISGYGASLIIFAVYLVLQTVDEVLMNQFNAFLLTSFAGIATSVTLILFLTFRRKDFLV